MFSHIRSSAVQYGKIKASYGKYLATYRSLNNGSSEGAVTFFQFYYYMNYVSRYSDPRSCAPLGYR